MCGIFFCFGKDGNFFEMKNLINSANSINVRGPEKTVYNFGKNTFYCFHRLAINNTSESCDQPYEYKHENEIYRIMCNGEIYNWKSLISKFDLQVDEHDNDCGVIFPLFKKFKFNFNELIRHLDGEFAIVITKESQSSLENIWFATDLCSVRPLFYTYDSINNVIILSSLLGGISSLNNITSVIKRVDGGISYEFNKKKEKFELITNPYSRKLLQDKDFYINQITSAKPHEHYFDSIVSKLTLAVHKRISIENTSRPLGCLLSGGLDSSLVAAIASEYLKCFGKKLNTFSIGMKGSTDLKYAKIVADFIGSNHTEIIFTPEEGLSVIEDVIKTCETYDITTIRASVGQYLLAKYIRENTDIKVLLNGDGADECQMGYLYFYKAPEAIEAQMDSLNLIRQIHYFDGLRVDRNISNQGLEARVPFLDQDFVNYMVNYVPAVYKLPKTFGCEKYLIRKAFEKYNLLPSEVLWRRKEAFSDGVSSKEKSWFEILTTKYNSLSIPDKLDRDNNPPYTKESTYYRLVFENLFKERNDNVIPRYWLPSWTTEKDPSARKLTEIYNKE